MDDKGVSDRVASLYDAFMHEVKGLTSFFHEQNGSALGCARDRDRTLTLMGKVFNLTQPGDTVIDLGAGLGVLGMAALAKGAEHVYFVSY